ncbi:aminotransferase class III-fold pyridoxal phosphate-dependent enzyme [Actinomadura sp. KC216]|uniref:aminotransferase class III-fold pyridoxal phosphate-dependent enzyme n=1 Tax=Actinomadura sp. KC216 TaxID=2530370 RepID=UPI0014048601|nr:aminotransferase class III-fold pyridoxal phosphate-dependent enzyme [Actinomadura sp. KC216]
MARSFVQSEAWSARADRVIPGGGQTLSKAPSQWAAGAPSLLRRAEGGHVWDVDGNEWVDFPMALGPVVLGHADPRVEQAIVRQLRDGISFTMTHPLEVEVAERIVELCPGVDAVRFAKTGSEATTAAVRLARARTGRERVLVCGYHGWHDWYAAVTPTAKGVPRHAAELVTPFPFNDLRAVTEELRAGDVAAVVLDPCGPGRPRPGFLEGVVEACRRAGALSIFDEVVAGFRVAPGGAREKYGVVPDLSCYGKALGNGMPLSAVAGGRETMREFGEVLVSGTYGGETLSLAAARTVLDVVSEGTVLPRIGRLGERLQAGMDGSVRRHGLTELVTVGGEPCRPVVGFGGDQVVKSWFQQCFTADGLLFTGTFNLCAAHSDEDLDRALTAFERACAALAEEGDATRLLQGAPVTPVRRFAGEPAGAAEAGGSRL